MSCPPLKLNSLMVIGAGSMVQKNKKNAPSLTTTSTNNQPTLNADDYKALVSAVIKSPQVPIPAPEVPSYSALIPSGLRSKLDRVRSAPPIKRLLATKELVKILRSGSISDCSEEVIKYFAVLCLPIFLCYRRLIDAELITYAELASSAGDGGLLTKLIRSIVADAPEIVTPFDAGFMGKRANVLKNWNIWSSSSSGSIVIARVSKRANLSSGSAGDRIIIASDADPLASVSFTKLAETRTRECNFRAYMYTREFPYGDGGRTNDSHEKKLWDEAERKIVG